MRFRYNETCHVCNKVFCCSSCRDKHVLRKRHYKIKKENSLASDTPLDCPLCAQQPMPLQRILNEQILQHIESEHLPLHCRKCSKVYHKIADLKNFTNCHLPQATCNVANKTAAHTTETPSNMAVATQSSISTQTSPLVCSNISIPKLTSLTQEHWTSSHKVIKDDYVSDSVSSIKNLSALSNGSMRRSIGIITTTTTSSKGKLVRTTSTPVQAELLPVKPKEQAFDASSGQMSSIHHSECDVGQERTPLERHFHDSPKQSVDNLYKYRRMVARPRVAPVTPLRQVMSKSIQKAFAEHRALPSGTRRVLINDRKKITQSFDNDSGSRVVNSTSSPLDLRISPVVRRSQQTKTSKIRIENMPLNMKMEKRTVIEQPHNQEVMTTESIVITRTKHVSSSTQNAYNTIQTAQGVTGGKESVYTTCQSVEIITATELSAFEATGKEAAKVIDAVTTLAHDTTPISREQMPMLQKKIINFETPKKSTAQCTSNRKTLLTEPTKHLNVSTTEKFFTPDNTPISQKPATSAVKSRKKLLIKRKLRRNFSPRKRPPIRKCIGSANFKRLDSDDDEVFVKATSNEQIVKNKKEACTGWSLSSVISSVIALPAAFKSSVRQRLYSDLEVDKFKNMPILKRCASFAGTLVRSHSLKGTEGIGRSKRKRTHTIGENQSSVLSQLNSSIYGSPENLSISKRLRIQPRKPIRVTP